MCIFESDTVKSDCPVQIFRKMMKYLKITFLVLLFFWRKKNLKKALKMNSQLVIFRAFLFIVFVPPRP